MLMCDVHRSYGEGEIAESSRVDPVVRYYLKHLQIQLQIQLILSENGFPIMGPIFPIRDNEVN